MDLIERIQNNFNKGFFRKAMLIDGLPEDYPAWTIKSDNWVGVAVPLDSPMSFTESFTNARIWVANQTEINGRCYDLLMFTTSDMEYRNEFATVCSQFVQPGPDGDSRKQLISHPEVWWSHWKLLLGNRNADDEAYSLLGELMVLEVLLKNGMAATWTGITGASHDIECSDKSYEVKSTVKRYGSEVTISSINQLKKSGESLTLAFCRFEPSLLGTSLDDVIDEISDMGYPIDSIEKAFYGKGLEKGCTARKAKYRLLEMKFYDVDDSFPAVTEKSFKNDRLPQSVTRFTYTIDLSGVPSKDIL